MEFFLFFFGEPVEKFSLKRIPASGEEDSELIHPKTFSAVMRKMENPVYNSIPEGLLPPDVS
jgi:hypothetical protein